MGQCDYSDSWASVTREELNLGSSVIAGPGHNVGVRQAKALILSSMT